MIKFTAELDSVAFKRTAVGAYGQHYTLPQYRLFKEMLGHLARIAMRRRKPLSGPVRVKIRVFRRYKPTAHIFGDADNHLKAILDSLNGICFLDDRQVVDARIQIQTGEPRIDIKVSEIQCSSKNARGT